jgi:hypothetical protein
MHTPPPAPLSPAPALTLTLTLALSLSLSLSLAPTAAVAQDAAAMPQMAPASFTPHHAVSVSILGLYAMAGTHVAPYAVTSTTTGASSSRDATSTSIITRST